MIGQGADGIDLMLAGRLDVAQGWGKGYERLQWHRASKRCSGILDRARSQDSAVAGDRRVQQRDARKKDVRARICCLACVGVKRGKAQCPHRGALMICALRASAVHKPALQTCSGRKTPRRACSTATRFAVDPFACGSCLSAWRCGCNAQAPIRLLYCRKMGPRQPPCVRTDGL